MAGTAVFIGRGSRSAMKGYITSVRHVCQRHRIECRTCEQDLVYVISYSDGMCTLMLSTALSIHRTRVFYYTTRITVKHCCTQ